MHVDDLDLFNCNTVARFAFSFVILPLGQPQKPLKKEKSVLYFQLDSATLLLPFFEQRT